MPMLLPTPTMLWRPLPVVLLARFFSPPPLGRFTNEKSRSGLISIHLGAFVLGPDKLASMAKDFGKVAGELKDVPKEFKEGLEEGEAAKAARVLESGEEEEESA